MPGPAHLLSQYLHGYDSSTVSSTVQLNADSFQHLPAFLARMPLLHHISLEAPCGRWQQDTILLEWLRRTGRNKLGRLQSFSLSGMPPTFSSTLALTFCSPNLRTLRLCDATIVDHSPQALREGQKLCREGSLRQFQGQPFGHPPGLTVHPAGEVAQGWPRE